MKIISFKNFFVKLLTLPLIYKEYQGSVPVICWQFTDQQRRRTLISDNSYIAICYSRYLLLSL